MAPAAPAPDSRQKPPRLLRGRLFQAVIVLSFAGNLTGLILLGKVIRGRGGIDYISAIATHDPSANPDPSYALRTGLFELSVQKAEPNPIVFVGDSLTQDGMWQEFFGGKLPILNRGIGGDTSVGVLRRIGQVTALKPLAVFLMIGINDSLTIGYSPADTAHVVHDIVGAIRRDSPGTLIYLQSLLPSRSPKSCRWSEEANRLIAPMADNHSVFFLNLRDRFVEDGLLARRLTRDGLHLSPEGFRVWRDALDPVISDLVRRRTGRAEDDRGRVAGIAE
jgi:lysophospholipase L1-like esterase